MCRTLGCVVALCLLAPPQSVRAQQVTVDLREATIQDVAAALAEQTGWRFQFVGSRKPAPEEVVLAEFKAEDRPLKEVLREACERTGYRFRRVQRELFWLDQGEFEESPYLAEADGYRVCVEQVSLNAGSAVLDFTRGPRQEYHSPPSLGVQISVEAPTDAAAERIYGLDDVTVTDDTGRVSKVPPERQQFLLRQLRFFPTPDKADLNSSFDRPPEDATRIEALEGVLLLYRNMEVLDYRFDDLTADKPVVQNGGLEVTLFGVRVSDGTCQVNIGGRVMEAVPEPDPDEWGLARFLLEGKDGSTCETQVWQLRPSPSTSYSFGIPEGMEPAAIIYRVTRRRYPDHELPFRIEDIPLPGRGVAEGEAGRGDRRRRSVASDRLALPPPDVP